MFAPILVLILTCGPQATAPSSPQSKPLDVENAAARATFDKLSPSEQKDLVEYFRLEASRMGSVQSELVRFVLSTQDRDASLWPEQGAIPWFDSKAHTPENDIPRHVLDPASEKVEAVRKRFFVTPVAGSQDGAWTYDYATRELRRSARWKDPARVFGNGLLGFAPDADLAEALVERALDDGAQQKVLAAFLHAYTDREGGVYPVTLYDAWASGAEIEMPDVDCLGIVHDVLGDWQTWHAPVPEKRHKSLYDKIGALFVEAHRHRGLRHALAGAYLRGGAALVDGYAGSLDNFHALWEDCRSVPADLAKRLPNTAGRAKFLASWVKTCMEKPEVWNKGLVRHRVLEEDARATRALLLRLLAEFAPPNPAPPGATDPAPAPPKDPKSPEAVPPRVGGR